MNLILPRYDEVYFEGLKWLDSLADDELSSLEKEDNEIVDSAIWDGKYKDDLTWYSQNNVECFETFENTCNKLEAIEKLLAQRLNLQGNAREELLTLDKQNLLVEDEVVADWHDLYASYLDWIDYNTADKIIFDAEAEVASVREERLAATSEARRLLGKDIINNPPFALSEKEFDKYLDTLNDPMIR